MLSSMVDVVNGKFCAVCT